MHCFKALWPIFFIILTGCATSNAVKDLGASLADSNEKMSMAHLETLSAYQTSLENFKTEISTLKNTAIHLSAALNQARMHQANSIRNELVIRSLDKYDTRVLEFLNKKLPESAEDLFWEKVYAKRDSAKANEAGARVLLKADPTDVAQQVAYRQFGIQSEHVLRIAFENESKRHTTLLEQFQESREKLRLDSLELLTSKVKHTSPDVSAITAEAQKSIDEIQRIIDRIIQAKADIEAGYAAQSKALEQINRYLEKPDAYKLFVTGIRDKLVELVSALGDKFSNKVSSYTNQVISKINSNSDALISSTNDKINQLVNTAAENFEKAAIDQLKAASKKVTQKPSQ
ncbi:hypothetical protein KFE80_05350 [bacterium SCSIO 12696]|nr:hypothetical protein KFE80_05350 [bacterium SCSIO 12696]